MKAKKIISLAAMLLTSCTVFAGCQGAAVGEVSAQQPEVSAETAEAANAGTETANKKVTLWAGGSDNVNQQFIKQAELFNSTNADGYQVEIQFITSGTGAQGPNERIIAAKLAGQTNTDYDLLEMGGEGVLPFIRQGGEDILLTLDKSKIPNTADLQFTAAQRDDLVVPYRGTTVVLAYNSEVVTEPPTTAEELRQWIIDHPGRFAYNTPDSGGAGSSFVNTAIYNSMPEESFTSEDEKWMAEWDKGFELLTELHQYMYKSSGKVVYPHKNQGSLDLLANKEVDMIPAWADMAISQTREGILPESIKISQIEPAFTGSTVVFGIPSVGSNPDGAYAFINFMLTPEAQNIALDSMAAIPVIDFAKLDPNLLPFISSLKIDTFRLSSIGALGTTLNERWMEEIATLG